MRHLTPARRTLALVFAITLVVAACGSDDATGGPALTVAESSLGQIIADDEGNTLYLFVPDNQGESTCYDQCAVNWPPVEGPVDASDGIEADLIGSVTRTDGTVQATYGGWPLYYFANDAQPGDTNGQGLNDVWFVISPDGAGVQ
jgi:predicted lipoprotein with Yx(FWY)xxD motif